MSKQMHGHWCVLLRLLLFIFKAVILDLQYVIIHLKSTTLTPFLVFSDALNSLESVSCLIRVDFVISPTLQLGLYQSTLSSQSNPLL